MALHIEPEFLRLFLEPRIKKKKKILSRINKIVFRHKVYDTFHQFTPKYCT